MAIVAAIGALTSRAAFNLPLNSRGLRHLIGVQDVKCLLVLFLSPLVADQSRFVCAKPCYAHFLIELLQIRLVAGIYTPVIPSSRLHLADLLLPLPPMQMGVTFEHLPLHLALFLRLEI